MALVFDNYPAGIGTLQAELSFFVFEVVLCGEYGTGCEPASEISDCFHRC